jgi:crotonobetainyl-CoA:carnitine CoA-transferase CaiB-like acyl-CoA transferase
MASAKEINGLIAELFSHSSPKDLVAEGQRRGVPMSAMQVPAQVLKDEHLNARGAFVPIEVVPGVVGKVPAGYLEIDSRRAGLRSGAPALGQHTDEVFADLAVKPRRPASSEVKLRRPLEGVRVLDLGVIVAGAEAGRILADQGAEVIKIENRAFPDGGRQSMTGAPMTPSIAQGHRNKLSMGVNLRSDKGREIFKQLVAKADVVLSNFKPGTLESLGLDYGVLKDINPRIVMMDSSALGNTGPDSRSMGYGPLVRASTGLSSLWCYPDVPNSFADGVTIYPDHVAGRVAAMGVLALLIRRERTGLGGTVSVSQAEIFLNSNADHYLRESLQPGTFIARGNVSEFRAPEGIYPCAGDDEWCALSVRNDEEWRRLLQVIGRTELLDDSGLASMAGRLERRAEVDDLVRAWTSQRSPREVTHQLQGVGLPAGFMIRLSEYRDDPHFKARDFIRSLEHEGLSEPLPTENRVVQSRYMPEPPLRPAPYQAEHTRQLAASLLGLQPDQIGTLIADGDLEDMAPPKAPAA